MSHFIRQLQVMSSLKTRADAEILQPFYKAVLPIAACPPSIRNLHTQVLDKNLTFQSQDSDGNQMKKKTKRQLAIVLSWLSAKGNHINKYCNIYLQRNYDVLTVHITPQQLLFPTTGSQLVAATVLKYIDNHREYDQILVHAFSVGAYLMGEVFVKLQQESKIKHQDLSQRIVGIILDSAVDVEGLSTALPRALAKNPLTVKVLEWYVNAHMAMMHSVATKHYVKASRSFHNTPLHCPALIFVSEADKVGTPAINQTLAEKWIAKGVDVRYKCFKKSQHVSHMYHYKDEYVREIDNLISKIKQKNLL